MEGYIESASSGMLAGINAANQVYGREKTIFSSRTATGALASYVSNSTVRNFQPMNVNFGIMASPSQRFKDKKLKYLEISRIALEEIKDYIASTGNNSLL